MKIKPINICFAGVALGGKPSEKFPAESRHQNYPLSSIRVQPVVTFRNTCGVFCCGAFVKNRGCLAGRGVIYPKARLITASGLTSAVNDSPDGEPPQQNTSPGRDYGSAIEVGTGRRFAPGRRDPGKPSRRQNSGRCRQSPHRKRDEWVLM